MLKSIRSFEVRKGLTNEIFEYDDKACITGHYHDNLIPYYSVQEPWQVGNDEVIFRTLTDAMDYIDKQIKLGYCW